MTTACNLEFRWNRPEIPTICKPRVRCARRSSAENWLIVCDLLSHRIWFERQEYAKNSTWTELAMRAFLRLIAIWMATSSVVLADETEKVDDATLIQGSWEATEVRKGGGVLYRSGDPVYKSYHRFHIGEDTIRIEVPVKDRGHRELNGRFKLDPEKNHFDVALAPTNFWTWGFYSLKEDALTIYLSRHYLDYTKKRPKSIPKTRAEEKHTVAFVLKRID